MRRALLLPLLLAGCVAAPAPDPAPPPARPSEEAVALEACEVVEAIVRVPEARARPWVPDAFDLAAMEGQATAILGGFTCAAGSRAFLAIAVVPRDERLRSPAASRHFFEPEHDLDASGLLDAFARMGALVTRVDRVHATATASEAALVVEAPSWRHEVRMRPGALLPGQGTANDAPFREYAAAEGGFAYVEARYQAAEGSRMALLPGTAVTGADTPSRAVLGERADAQVFALHAFRLADATVGFVPWP